MRLCELYTKKTELHHKVVNERQQKVEELYDLMQVNPLSDPGEEINLEEAKLQRDDDVSDKNNDNRSTPPLMSRSVGKETRSCNFAGCSRLISTTWLSRWLTSNGWKIEEITRNSDARKSKKDESFPEDFANDPVTPPLPPSSVSVAPTEITVSSSSEEILRAYELQLRSSFFPGPMEECALQPLKCSQHSKVRPTNP